MTNKTVCKTKHKHLCLGCCLSRCQFPSDQLELNLDELPRPSLAALEFQHNQKIPSRE